MLPEPHPLIQALTKPLADNAEQHLAARSILEETLVPGHPAVPETLKRLENIPERKHPGLWQLALGICASAALMLSIIPIIPSIRLWNVFYDSSSFQLPDPLPLPSSLTPQQRLLFSNPALVDSERLRLLVESDPDDPALYSEYAGSYAYEHKALPPGYLETVARIAPDNSFFLYFAAAQIGGEAIEGKQKKNQSSAPVRYAKGIKLRPLPIGKEFKVIDDKAFAQALALIEKARSLPDFETYINTMTSRRTRLLPDETLTDRLGYQSLAWGGAGGIISLRKIADIFSAQTQLLSREGKKSEFLSLVGSQRHLVGGLSKNPDLMLLGELVYTLILSSTAQYFHTAAESLGLDEVASSYAAQMHAIQRIWDERTIRAAAEIPGVANERGSILSTHVPNLARQVAHPPQVSETDLRPLRLVDHEVASRFASIAAALILALACIPLYLFRYHSPRPVRVPAIRLSKLLRVSDWAWIISLGVVLPIVGYLAINRLTPLGGREYGMGHFLFLFPAVQFLAILFTLLLAPAVLIRWRLGKRLAPFGIKSHPSLISIAVLFLILLWSLAVYPIIEGAELSRNHLIALAAIPALWVGNVFLNLLLALLGKPDGRIPRVATTSALLPAYAAGIIALCLTLPLFIASEKHWMKQDTLFKIDPDAPDLGAYEYKVAAQKRKELKAILAH